MNKIDFALIISAQLCNPNGDPLNNNRPRQDFHGCGIISDVCLKRKIRNRLQDLGEEIIMISNDRVTDGLMSVKERVEAHPDLFELMKKGSTRQFLSEACKIWTDVRTFGQVFALNIRGKGKEKEGVSMSVRGPVSIGMAKSLLPVDIMDFMITKSTNNDKTSNDSIKDSSTIGLKYRIDKGAYVAYGSIFPQLAEKTGFSESDIENLKLAMSTILENDSSSNRPSGSMTSKLYWWTHSKKIGNENSMFVYRSLNVSPHDEWPYFSCNPENISGITLEIL